MVKDSRCILLQMKAVPCFRGHTYGAKFWLAVLFTHMPENLKLKAKYWQGIFCSYFQFSFCIPPGKWSSSPGTRTPKKAVFLELNLPDYLRHTASVLFPSLFSAARGGK